MKRVSITKQLFILLLPFLFGLWIASAVLSYWLVSNFSGDAFDRDLINSADSIVGRVRQKGSKISVDLPPAAQAILKRDGSDRLYYRVLGPEEEFISGDANLPPPSHDLQIDIPKVVTATVSGKNVRLAELKASLNEPDARSVIVQVAETTNARKLFQEKMLLSIAMPQLLVLIVGLAGVWYGIAKILNPLRILQQEMVNRSQADLSPLSDHDTPEEVYPLVKAINHLFDRSREELKAHQRFIANAAHQLRTPLAGLKTYSSIGSEMSDAQELKHIVHELDVGVDRASRMVSQLLALARTDSGDPDITVPKSHIDLNFLVSDIVSEFVDQAVRKNIEISFDSTETPAIIDGEQTGLRHLVVNLVENAILYTQEGGKVIVRLKQNGHVTLSVLDNGPGIASEEQEKVFERFYRSVNTNGIGSGLGLAIVKEVANAHKASISIESAPAGGTQIAVKFPRPEK